MCGISAVWGVGEDEETVEEMVRRQRHRGPDGQGVTSTERGVMGHCRLAIMDPQHGAQPMISPDRRRVIVANGEIYNYPRLSRELKPRHSLRTASDSEIILHLFEEFHEDTPAELDGMFAYVLMAGDDVYAARDPLGIKPLYWGRRGESLVFGSELKVFDGLAQEVREFPPGCWMRNGGGFHPYRPLPEREIDLEDTDEAARLIRETLECSVVKRLMSDVPVGCFLSGGLDSSLLTALARRHLDELHTFAVGMEGSRDLEAARAVARHLDTIHHEYAFTQEEVQACLPEILYMLESFDQDLVRSAIPCYFVSRLAAEHVKVVLTGEGADELYAGYTYYKDLPADEVLQRELHRSVRSLHNMNLQRVDRMTMAHSLEGRVPFLDLESIALAQRIPAALKLRVDAEGTPVEKWILRKAGEGLLPDDILWRKKEQFDEGSGTADLMTAGLDHFLPPSEFAAYADRYEEDRLRSREEAAYHKLLCDGFEDDELVLRNVARWTDRPDFTSTW